MATSMPTLANFDVHSDPSSLFSRWQKWIRRFEGAMTGFGITDDGRKKALLLHYGGEDLDDVFQTLKPTDNTYTKAKEVLETYFQPKQNTMYETIIFRRERQQQGESIDQYCTRLRKLAERCNFTDAERELKTQIIEGCLSSQLRRKALEKDRGLEEILELARSISLSETRTKEVEHVGRAEANHLRTAAGKQKQSRSWGKAKPKPTPDHKQQCYHCGGSYPHAKKCPAKGMTCNAVCKSAEKSTKDQKKRVKGGGKANALTSVEDAEETSDSDYVFQLSSSDTDQPRATVCVNNTPVQALIDSGATVNVMSRKTYNLLSDCPKLNRNRHKVKIFSYGSNEPLPTIGTFKCTISFKDNTTTAIFHVVEGDSDTLLSCNTGIALRMIALTYAIPSATDLEDQYADLFKGLGKLKGTTCTLHVDPDVPPVTHQHRRVPFHVRKQTEKELDRLKKLDIIEPVQGESTPWVSSIQVVKKPNSENGIRICVDMRAPNRAIKRERHVTPTIDDIIQKVNGANIFSKLDLNAGYHQIELSEESRHLTVFSTHVGLFRYKRLNFGVNSAAEVFQHMIQTALQGLDGCLNISDDILIYANTPEEHHTRLHACLQRLRECNLTLGRKKCQFGKREIEFFGHVFSSDGVSPDPLKVQAIASAQDPTNVQEVRSLLGLVTYCNRFIPNLATLSAPLRDLTKDKVKWEWTSQHKRAMQEIRNSLSEQSINAFFDPEKSTQLIVDASPVGLGALLAQTTKDGKTSVIAFTSRSLTPVEQRYSQTEREALSITWAILHFHLYVYGSNFTVITDHRPLVSLFNNANSKPPTRIERWILKLQEYEFCVTYEPGKTNPADYLSRHPLPSTRTTSREEKAAEQHINFISAHAVPKMMSLQDIKDATKADESLNLCMEAIKSGSWEKVVKESRNDEIASLKSVKDDLTVNATSDLVLRNNRIVVPMVLRERIVDIAHEGHQGVVKTKQLLREKVWFPGIDRIVERKIKQCIPCQATSASNLRDPINMSELPSGPWVNVSIDFADLPSGEHLLVIVDDHSRYPVVEIVTSTSAKAVIPKLDRVFAMFGVSEVVRSDNGPPYNSIEFAKFAHYLGFSHRKITPRWPRANGEVERLMRTLKKVIRTAVAESKSWKQELYRFLRNYRATPHATTSEAPATLMFGRPLRTRLPEVPRQVENSRVRDRDSQNKSRMKRNAERHMKMRQTPLKCGDKVLVKRDGYVDKFTTPFDPKPFVVVSTKGSMITARRGKQTITRNASFFKVLDMSLVVDNTDSDFDCSDNEQDNEQMPDIPRRNPIRERRRPRRYDDFV
ncbi:uncharacterized protein K02A2.6-like [Lytechinus variegatus]|uniref:uncharacterized protein K02A2.6-like n=1 Tax=Lytechinus variegatus TaxID=7654 RepID=UPI001BB1859F|nr:uncharacterized protein K02A2.6-like [Lytechinus variegatus]